MPKHVAFDCTFREKCQNMSGCFQCSLPLRFIVSFEQLYIFIRICLLSGKLQIFPLLEVIAEAYN